MQNSIEKHKKKIGLVILFIVVFTFGILVGKSQTKCKICPAEDVDLSLFWEAWHKVHKRFVDPSQLDTQKMIYGAIKGMVNSLGDPYTVFFDPEETKIFLEDVSGTFEGVGMEIGIRKGQLQVIAPLEGTPAQKAGLRAGDKIIKIDDVSTYDMTIEEAVKLIRGPKGTKVVLTIMREGWDKPKEFSIKRAVIEIPCVKWSLISSETKNEDKNGDIAYINIYQFSEKTSSDFAKIALEILKSPAKKLIVDLRNNPGGYLEVAQDVAGWFLKRGSIVVCEDFGKKKKKKCYKAKGNGQLSQYPMVVLINQGSASASEILASALRDNLGVKLIGEKSYGKGSVQELASLKDGSSLKITIAKWLTPKGELISKKGLEPDIKVEFTEEDYDQGRDPQKEKAIEILKEL